MRLKVAQYLAKSSGSESMAELLKRADAILRNRNARLPILGYSFDGNNYLVIRDSKVKNDHGLRGLTKKYGIFVWGE